MNNDPHDDTNLERQQDLRHSNLERRQDLRRDEEAFRLQQEEKRLGTAQQNTTFMWIVNSIYWLAGMLEILLVLRFLLRLFGANPDNEFAQLINNLSMPFMTPFSTLFISPTTAGAANIFDVNILIAILVYALLSYLLVSLVRFVFYSFRQVN